MTVVQEPPGRTGDAERASNPPNAALQPIDQAHVTRIEPPSALLALPNLGEVWRYRDLLLMLMWRDLSARYRQSIVGYGWAFIRPVLSVVIFAIVFGGLAGLPSDGIPYPLFVLAALIPWNYFATSMAGISSSVVSGAGLFTKVYFPRLILPLASMTAGLAELALQLVLMVGLMAWFKSIPTWAIVVLPLFVLLTMATSLAVGLWLSALNVRYRDVGHAVPFLLQAWMWISPVAYSTGLVPEKWQWAYSLNPMVITIDGFRWALLGARMPSPTLLVSTTCVVTIVLIGGMAFFQQQDSSFADVV